jgi:hypothetical protein
VAGRRRGAGARAVLGISSCSFVVTFFSYCKHELNGRRTNRCSFFTPSSSRNFSVREMLVCECCARGF